MTRSAPAAVAARIVVAAIAVAVAGCMPAGPTPAGTIPPTGAPPGGPSITLDPSVSATPEPTPDARVTEDDALLAILPGTVGGVAVAKEELAFQAAATDPDFVANVDAAVFAVAVDEANIASAVVARLRPGVFSEPFFRDWRDSYDEGACGQSGGVTGNAEAELGGRTTFITTCAGGLTAYHAHLAERGIIVSLISVGEGRFGEQLMRDLRP